MAEKNLPIQAVEICLPENASSEAMNNSVMKIDLKDQIALGFGSKHQKELYELDKKQEYQNITSCISNRLPEMFKKAYEIEVLNSMETNSLGLLRYFRILKDTSPDKYNSFNKIINSASEYKKVLTQLKIQHGNLASKFGQIKTKLSNSYPICLRTITNLSCDDYASNNSALDSILGIISLDGELEKCKEILDSIESIANRYQSLNDYNQIDRENLSIILGSDVVKEVIDNCDKELEIISEEIKMAKKSFSDAKQEKYQIECDKKFNELKIEQLNKLAEQKQIYLDKLNQEIKRLYESMDANMVTKTELLQDFHDPEKYKEYFFQHKKIRVQFDDQYAKSLLEINKDWKDLFDDIKKVKVVKKDYSIIFILDESGSMSSCFNQVVSSVEKIINKRKSDPIAKDKVSVIKFNTKAIIEHINVDIKEEITISPLKGGGTSFIEPLKKLEDVLSQIDKDLFIPIVFFLSDGYGESRSSVLDYCNKVYNKFSTMDMLFFCVGYENSNDAPGKIRRNSDNELI